MTIPVVLFLHSRPSCALAVVNDICSSSVASDIELYIFVDGPRSEEEAPRVTATIDAAQRALKVQSFLGIIHWQISEFNKGLARSVIEGVSSVLEDRDWVIVLEDDLLLSPVAIEYLSCALEQYAANRKVFSVTAYNYPPKVINLAARPESGDFFLPRPSSWAWGTWRRVWDSIEWDGPIYDEFLMNTAKQRAFGEAMGHDVNRMLKKQLRGTIDSWAVRFTFNCFLQGGLVSYPSQSLVSNSGANGGGTHKGNNREYIENGSLLTNLNSALPFTADPVLSKSAHREFTRFTKKRFLWRRAKAAVAKRIVARLKLNRVAE